MTGSEWDEERMMEIFNMLLPDELNLLEQLSKMYNGKRWLDLVQAVQARTTDYSRSEVSDRLSCITRRLF